MPGGDRTGPQGKGSRTGRGLGFCSGSDKPGYQSNEEPQGKGFNNNLRKGRGLGLGAGRGQGRGLGRRQE